GIEVTDEEMKLELDALLPRVAPGQTLEEVLSSGVYSLAYLEQVARTNRGRNELFWKSKNIPDDKHDEPANQFLMQIWLNEVKNRFQIAIRGQKPSPPKGALAALTTIIDGQKKSYTVTPEEAMEFLIGVLRPAAVVKGLDELVESHLVALQMAKKDVKVTDSEVEGWVREMRTKYTAPFNWDMILRVQGLTADQARRRWHDVQAWKRCNDIEITDKKLHAFREAHDDFFRSRHVKVRHVLCKFTNDVTGMSAGEDAEANAKARAETVYRLASEGVDFQKLAQSYSDDTTTKENGGMIGQPIKKWGGGYDPDFQDAAYALHRGELSKPVRTTFGWHVIYCEEESPATTRDIDWDNPRYADWITEEYENYMSQEWKRSLLSKAKITKVSPDELLKIKNATFQRGDK
ncbi:MAG: peptidylprolyl isomerase, partial [Salinibacterium sp.]|nr:peptidylprolyl isomerase [Salinibacterium sp.]